LYFVQIFIVSQNLQISLTGNGTHTFAGTMDTFARLKNRKKNKTFEILALNRKVRLTEVKLET
jgi:hypothetical protein